MKILAVDDEKMTLEGMCTEIRKVMEDADIYAFTKVSEALQAIEANVFELAFLDIRMPVMNGLELAKVLKKSSPKVNIVFCTGFDEYVPDALRLHASAFLEKPVFAEDIQGAMDNLLYPIEHKIRLQVRCFGYFEVCINDVPIKFKRNKTRELLAYLVHTMGRPCTNKEIEDCLWGIDGDHASALRDLKSDLKNTLRAYGAEDIIAGDRGLISIVTDRLDCDYYDWCRDPEKVPYKGEYMEQYSWSNERHEELERYRINELRENSLAGLMREKLK